MWRAARVQAPSREVEAGLATLATHPCCLNPAGLAVLRALR